MSNTHYLQLRVESWEEAVAVGKAMVSHVFRGQANADWWISTSLERAARRYGFPEGALQNRENVLLQLFQRQAHHYIDELPRREDLLEWLALMQHHGAPTRLVDFSKSFYIAAFFAMESSDQDAAVWAFSSNFTRGHTSNLLEGSKTVFDLEEESRTVVGEYLEGKRTDKCVMLVEPFRMNERLAVQQGCFVVPGDVERSFMQNLAEWLDVPASSFDSVKTRRFRRSDADRLLEIPVVKIILPIEIHNTAVWDLDTMNVNARSLFAGLDGFARSMHTWFRDVV